MPWQSLDKALVAQVAKILKTRREHPALSRGGRIPLSATKDHLVMAKVTPEETVFVGVNLGNEPKDIVVDASGLLTGEVTLTPLLGDTSVSFTPGTGQLKWRLPASSTVLVAAPGGFLIRP